MKVLLIIAFLLIPSIATAGVMPWEIKSKLSLGLEKEDLPYMPDDAEKHYDLALEFSSGYGMARGINAEWKVRYMYEKWFEHENEDNRDMGHTYRVEYHIHF